LATHVVLLPLRTHVALAPHEYPSHGWPIAESGKHVPQVVVPPSFRVTPVEHAPLWHCESVTHALPTASEPVVTTHVVVGEPNAAHPSLLTELAHELSESTVRPWPGSASVCAHSLWNRTRMRATSSAGGLRVEQPISASKNVPQAPSVDPPPPPPPLALELLCPECPLHASASRVVDAKVAPMK
jgi:hypothetical protein